MVLGLLSKDLSNEGRDGDVSDDLGITLATYLTEALKSSVSKCLSPYLDLLTYRIAELCDEPFMIASEVLARDLGEPKYLIVCRDLRKELLKTSSLVNKLKECRDFRDGLQVCKELMKSLHGILEVINELISKGVCT